MITDLSEGMEKPVDKGIFQGCYSELSPTQTVHLREVSAYREFYRYSNMTEKWRAGTNTKCPSYRGVR